MWRKKPGHRAGLEDSPILGRMDKAGSGKKSAPLTPSSRKGTPGPKAHPLWSKGLYVCVLGSIVIF